MALRSVELNSLQLLFPRDWRKALISFLKFPHNRVPSFGRQRLALLVSNLGSFSFCLKYIFCKTLKIAKDSTTKTIFTTFLPHKQKKIAENQPFPPLSASLDVHPRCSGSPSPYTGPSLYSSRILTCFNRC